MSGAEPVGPSADEMSGSSDFGYAWVTTGRVDDFVKRMKAMREGETPATALPATAIRALHAFAVKRPIAELIESSVFFDYRDAVNVLATAALCRNVKQAAELARGQWDAERASGREGTPLTDGIIHDVACQRTALDVAVFIRECRRAGESELVDKTLRVFARLSSGRTNLDKALLYIALCDEKCEQEAAELLRRTLAAIDEHGSAQASDTDPVELHDLVGALHQLSPSERILEKWIDGELSFPERVPRTRQLVGRLIVSRPDGPDTLIEHVGRRWQWRDLVEVCGQLSRHYPKKCAAVRQHAASRTEVKELAEIIIAWQQSEPLVKTTKDLLADIVATGTERAGPRSLADLDGLHIVLRNFKAHPQCDRLLRIAAALHIDGRTADDLVTLLSKVEQRRDRQRVAQTIGERLAARVLETGADTDLFVEYVGKLRSAGYSEAVYSARRELADPSGSDQSLEQSAALIAEVADRLYRKDLADDGWDLLERYMENEQRVTPQDVAVVVARLCDIKMDEKDRYFLLRATVGRWSDVRRRDEAVAELQRAGFRAEAAAVIRSLR
jgi:hypothetical protein